MLYSWVFLCMNLLRYATACSDFFMGFTDPSLCLSGRTQDIGSSYNNTVTSWPVDYQGVSTHENAEFSFAWTSKYNTLGITGNYFGDDRYGFPALVFDGINDQGLSCSMLALIGTKYEKPSPRKKNMFYGVFCLWAMQTFSNVNELYDTIDDIRIWGPSIVAEHFVLRDKTGTSLVIELIEGEKRVYLDRNDGSSGVGIMTNEPAFDWHLTNIEHYEWKRSLARQAVEVPGGWYPEDRFLRVYMVKQGMQEMGLLDSTHDMQAALSLTVQVLNTVTVPMGLQYGTDTGENSGEGSSADHTMFAVIRDHSDPALYWRDSGNPSLRRVRMADLDFSPGSPRLSLVMETGPAFVDMSSSMIPS